MTRGATPMSRKFFPKIRKVRRAICVKYAAWKRVVAIDYDDTIAEYRDDLDLSKTNLRKDENGETAVTALQRLRDAGLKIAIWTARGDDEDGALAQWLTSNGVPFDFINDNPYQPTDSRKIMALAYADDRAVLVKDRLWADIVDDILARDQDTTVKQPVSDEASLLQLASDSLEQFYALLSAVGYPVVEVDASVESFAEALAERGGVVIVPPMKTPERAAEKVADDYGGDWSRLLDLLRASVAVDELSEVYQAVQFIGSGGAGEEVRLKDRFAEPEDSGYRDVLANYRLPSGLVVEVQFHLKEMLLAREEVKGTYEWDRLLPGVDDTAARQRFEEVWQEAEKEGAMSKSLVGKRIGLPVVEKITRDAFLYLDAPNDVNGEDHAQCVSCRMFVPEEELDGFRDYNLCIGHGSNVKVGPRYSCGFYAKWPNGTPEEQAIQGHAAELEKDIPPSFTPEESGLVEREVRCENCAYEREDATQCHLFYTLTEQMPDVFDLDVNIAPHACCNAQTAKGEVPEPKGGRLFHRLKSRLAGGRKSTGEPDLPCAQDSNGSPDWESSQGKGIFYAACRKATSLAEQLVKPIRSVRGMRKWLDERKVIPPSAEKVKDFPDLRQTVNYSCGAVALEAVARFYNVGGDGSGEDGGNNEKWFMDHLGTTSKDGTPPNRLIELAPKIGLEVKAVGKLDVAKLKSLLDLGLPVIVLLQAWGNPQDYKKLDDGHYCIALGYDDTHVYFEDPSLERTRGYLEWEQFENRWVDTDGKGTIFFHWGLALARATPEPIEPIE